MAPKAAQNELSPEQLEEIKEAFNVRPPRPRARARDRAPRPGICMHAHMHVASHRHGPSRVRCLPNADLRR